MADWVSRQEEVVAAGGTGIDEDTAFHFAIARAAHNNLILIIVHHINDALRESREWSLRARTGARRSHHNILAAIAGHDALAAQTAMAAHLEDVQVMALRWLRERGDVLSPDTRGPASVADAAFSG